MKILLFGKNGQVAHRLYIALLPLGSLIVYGSQELDFRNFDKIRECIRNHNPDVIINAAGYTEVDKAESESDVAFAINTEAVRVIAEESANINAWLIHYSSEYVFDGAKNGAYTEEDIANPLNIYGKSKIAADEYIQSITKKYIILRTSWVYDSYGKNFANTILTLAQRNESLKVVDDQIGAPTNATLIASVTSFIVYRIKCYPDSTFLVPQDNANLAGIYNLSASGEVSWYSFAQTLLKEANNMGAKFTCLSENVIPIPSKDYPTSAKRPMNSRLDTSKLVNKFGLVMPGWEVYIPSLLRGLKVMSSI
jgi:dTDP-4-dehydrorhamnose reductase